MAEPRIKVVIEADGAVKEGEIRPELGARVEARFGDVAKCKIGVSYKDPDSLELMLAGDLSLRVADQRKVKIGGELERSLLDGTTAFHGFVKWEIPKSASVEITTDLAADEDEVGVKVTLQF